MTKKIEYSDTAKANMAFARTAMKAVDEAFPTKGVEPENFRTIGAGPKVEGYCIKHWWRANCESKRYLVLRYLKDCVHTLLETYGEQSFGDRASDFAVSDMLSEKLREAETIQLLEWYELAEAGDEQAVWAEIAPAAHLALYGEGQRPEGAD